MRSVDADRLLLELLDLADEFSELDERGLHNERWCGIMDSKQVIVNAPTIELKQGEWIKEYTQEEVRSGRRIFRQVGYSCSNCGESVDRTYPNCPYCLSKMTIYNSMKGIDDEID